MRKKIPPFKQPDPIPFTKHGYDEKQQEYEKLLAERPAAVADLKKAREMGDLSENGYYKSARWKLSDVDRQLRHLRHLLHYGKIMENTSSDTIEINSTVTVDDVEQRYTYHVVGDFEADPKEKKISQHSPLGKALVGKSVGDTAVFETRAGKRTLRILSIN